MWDGLTTIAPRYPITINKRIGTNGFEMTVSGYVGHYQTNGAIGVLPFLQFTHVGLRFKHRKSYMIVYFYF